MLSRLSVDNYALIDHLDLELSDGLNILTGETGAGKSIILGALGLILGNRGDSAAIRHPERNCVIEGEFNVEGYGLEPVFQMLDLDYDPVTIFRRILTPAGKSRSYINDIPVSLTTLREIGNRLIDIHSQHQTLLLGDNHFQINLLDCIACHDELLAQYRESFASLKQKEKQLGELIAQSETARKDTDYFQFQFDELSNASLRDGEQEELETLQKELSHASEIKESLLYTQHILDGDENGLLLKLKEAVTITGRLHDVYPQSEELHRRLQSVLLELKDISGDVSSEEARIEADPQKLADTDDRLDLIYRLQQKHKTESVGELLDLQADYEQRLLAIENSDETIATLRNEIEKQRDVALKQAAVITANRKKAIPEVERHVKEVLSDLGMPAAQLTVELKPIRHSGDALTLGAIPESISGLLPTGADEVKFLFTANRNTSLQPIEKVASGGEMSRLMLALKSLVASHSQLPTLIFDEIDTGVSGSIADKMGDIIFGLTDKLQVLNITHLPQVASKGETHFFVYKEELDGQTVTQIRKLGPEERIDEIAKMLSGSNVTAAAIEQAKLLLGHTV